MAAPTELKKLSLIDFNDGGKASLEHINTGCFQRIANATETIAQNYIKLQQDLDYYKNKTTFWREQYEAMVRSNSALKGHLTRLKNKK